MLIPHVSANIVDIILAAHPASLVSAAGLQMAGLVPSVLGKSHRRRIKRGIDWLPRTNVPDKTDEHKRCRLKRSMQTVS